MNSWIHLAIGSFFIIIALVLGGMAAKDRRGPDGRCSIAARTRLRIALIFLGVGAALVSYYMLRISY